MDYLPNINKNIFMCRFIKFCFYICDVTKLNIVYDKLLLIKLFKNGKEIHPFKDTISS